MVRQTLMTCLKSLWVLLPSLLYAQTLDFVVTESVLQVHPNFQTEMETVLKETGLNFRINAVPGERAFQMLKNGHAAVDLFRSPRIVSDDFPMIILQPPIRKTEFKLIVQDNQQSLCELGKAEFKAFNVIGISKARVNQTFVFPLFNQHLETEHLEHALLLLEKHRFEFIAWPDPNEDSLENEPFIICDQPLAVVKVNGLMHPDFEWAKEPIEAAFRKHFGD